MPKALSPAKRNIGVAVALAVSNSKIREGGSLSGAAPPVPSRSEAVERHHLGPCADEVTHELFLAVVRRIDLGDRAQF